MEATNQRWRELCSALRLRGDFDSVFHRIETQYSDASRAYHNLHHISDCLRSLDEIKSDEHPHHELEFAIWFHDVVYDSRAKDNESRSARAACETISDLKGSDTLSKDVSDLILATAHVEAPLNDSSRLIVDIDLAILGQPEEVFDKYENNVRLEYAWVPDDVFRRERSRILESFLNRETLFWTEHFRSKLEERARQNLSRSLARLKP